MRIIGPILIDSAAYHYGQIGAQFRSCCFGLFHGVNGFLIPPKNPDILSQKIIQLIKNEDLSKRIGLEARNTAVSKLPSVRASPAPAAPDAQAALARGDLTLKEAEKQLIIRALKETDGNRTLAAKKLGMSRRSLHRKLHEYHLENL